VVEERNRYSDQESAGEDGHELEVVLDTRDLITSDVSEAEKEGPSERRAYSWT
jgi:hypothetical protein